MHFTGMIVALLLLFFSGLLEAQIAVGPLSARAGQIASGTLDVPAAGDAGSQIPVTVVSGASRGPTLALVAGMHGYEYTPILAMQRLRATLNPPSMRGNLIIVHVANMPSFLGRTIYFSPADRKNLNRVFPGNPKGSTSERIAHVITTQVIEKADFLLDLHCGDGNESLRPYVYQAVTGDRKMDDATAGLARAFGLDHIVIDRGRPTDPAASVYCSTTAITRGKPALTAEVGFLGVPDPDSIERILRGVSGVMRKLNMIDGPEQAAPEPVYLDPAEVVASPATGILYPRVERGQYVRSGAVVAEVTDFFGAKLADVRAPFAGVVLYVVATPPIVKDQPVAFVGRVSDLSAK